MDSSAQSGYKMFDGVINQSIPPSKVREFLIDNEYQSDIHFLLGDQEEIFYGHKIFFISASPYFHEKLWNTKVPIKIKMKQISKPIFTEVARFIYTEKINLNLENVMEILYASKQLKMNYLTDMTMDFIRYKTGKTENQQNVSEKFINLSLDENQEEAGDDEEPTNETPIRQINRRGRGRGRGGNRSGSTYRHKEKKVRPDQSAEITGTPVLMKFREAFLKFQRADDSIVLKEIHFCSDLSKTDKEFEVLVTFFNKSGLQTDLFYGQVHLNKTDTVDGRTRYILDKKCVLFGSSREFLITVKFSEDKLRHVLGQSAFLEDSLKIFPSEYEGQAQIIQKIVFT